MTIEPPDSSPSDSSDRDTVAQPGSTPVVPPGHSVLEALGRDRSVKSVHLRDEPSQMPGPMMKPLAPSAHGVQEQAGKYRVRGELARGGVGVVFKGHDTDLGRDVALKFLQGDYSEDKAFVQRFIEEAQIGAQLQHPGIVPVYDLGLTGDRPYFTMKLIKGRTLSAILLDRTDPSQDRRTMLRIFEQVCQTMAYAHARGVVHRDLKPANVMIGSFGEVHIVDWGMGKVMQAGGVADEERAARHSSTSIIETVRARFGSHSVAGSMMGTPAYMSPEQAHGDVEVMDERSDVFSLGAVLCEILTGQPPYVGEFTEVIQAARACDLKGALERLEACDADPAVVAVAVDCLAVERSARPRSAGEVAERIGGYLAAAEERVREAQVRATAAKRTQKFAVGIGLAIAAGLIATLWFWREARDALSEYELLANVVRLREAREIEAALYPAWPDQVEPLRSWLSDRAEPLDRELPQLEVALASLQEQGVASGAGFDFDDESMQFKHDTLQELVVGLRAFVDPQTGPISEVRGRLEWAESVEDLTLRRFERLWSEAREAIARADGIVASRAYALHPIDLKPQVGLVPLGMNPVTKLWEFYHLRSAWDARGAKRPSQVGMIQRDEDGQVVPGASTGMVFVLIPGGTFSQGAQATDPDGVNHDPAAQTDESPVQSVTLDPFFLSKYEVSQGQWARLSSGDAPSSFRAGSKAYSTPITEAHPVETVSWGQCSTTLRRHGLELPTEAQWEYACRAGTTTPWATGTTAASVEGAANVGDASVVQAGLTWSASDEVDDGFVPHAPVGSFAANAFGLHDMMGNVWEWCRDAGLGYAKVPARERDGLREEPGGSSTDGTARVSRGGSFAFDPTFCRSARRYFDSEQTRDGNLGVRPIRVIDR